MTSAFPPAASIFFLAERLKAWARTVRGREISPSPKIFTPNPTFFTSPEDFMPSTSTTAPSGKGDRSRRLTTLHSLREGFLNPRLGSRRWRGICPPSKPGERFPPDRALYPLCPLVEVPPCPDPSPRPILFLFFRAP